MTAGDVIIGWAGMVLPVLILCVFAILSPWYRLRGMPETYGGLANVFVRSAIDLCFIAALYFFFEYLRQGVPAAALLKVEAVMHIGRLVALTSICWVPIVVTVLISQPSNWRPDL